MTFFVRLSCQAHDMTSKFVHNEEQVVNNVNKKEEKMLLK